MLLGTGIIGLEEKWINITGKAAGDEQFQRLTKWELARVGGDWGCWSEAWVRAHRVGVQVEVNQFAEILEQRSPNHLLWDGKEQPHLPDNQETSRVVTKPWQCFYFLSRGGPGSNFTAIC